MGKVIFYLLGFLNIEKEQTEAAQPIQILVSVHFLVFYLFSFQTHISTNSSNSWSFLHIVIHFVESLRIRPQTHIQQNGVFGF